MMGKSATIPTIKRTSANTPIIKLILINPLTSFLLLPNLIPLSVNVIALRAGYKIIMLKVIVFYHDYNSFLFIFNNIIN
jgi:hypothetical protein